MTTEQNKQLWKLPEGLRLATPEQLAAADAAQRDLARRAQSPFASLSPGERERERAARQVEELSATADRLLKEIARLKVYKRPQLRRRRELAAAVEALPAVLQQLAEAHAACGRFDSAAELHPDEGERALYAKYWRAVWRDDSDWCACGEEHQFAIIDIFSVRHRRVMPLLGCNLCGEANVAPLPGHISEGRSARAAALAEHRGSKQ